ncbi:transcriptional repressor [Streptomyces sp. NBC_00704]|nr:transcriptional repressor [Streptomyces sp. NBC_00704]
MGVVSTESTDWKSDLRQRGYRLTPQRQLVLEAVDTLEHATPDAILVEVRKTASGVNISTVYRTLELLEELGLVSHAHLGHGAPTYHLADRHHHIHLVCRDCDDVIEADVQVAAEFTAKLRETFGFETDMKHFAIFGRCRDCAQGSAGKGAGAGSSTGSRAAAGAGSRAGAGAGAGGGSVGGSAARGSITES